MSYPEDTTHLSGHQLTIVVSDANTPYGIREVPVAGVLNADGVTGSLTTNPAMGIPEQVMVNNFPTNQTVTVSNPQNLTPIVTPLTSIQASSSLIASTVTPAQTPYISFTFTGTYTNNTAPNPSSVAFNITTPPGNPAGNFSTGVYYDGPTGASNASTLFAIDCLTEFQANGTIAALCTITQSANTITFTHLAPGFSISIWQPSNGPIVTTSSSLASSPAYISTEVVSLPPLTLYGQHVKVNPIAQPVVSTSVYMANECVGGLITIPSPFRHFSGTLESIHISSLSPQAAYGAGFTVLLFDTQPTSTIIDSSIPTILSADVPACITSYQMIDGISPRPTFTLWRLDTSLPLSLATDTLWIVLLAAPLTQGGTTSGLTFASTSDLSLYCMFNSD